jgi:hypothetical protein
MKSKIVKVNQFPPILTPIIWKTLIPLNKHIWKTFAYVLVYVTDLDIPLLCRSASAELSFRMNRHKHFLSAHCCRHLAPVYGITNPLPCWCLEALIAGNSDTSPASIGKKLLGTIIAVSSIGENMILFILFYVKVSKKNYPP